MVNLVVCAHFTLVLIVSAGMDADVVASAKVTLESSALQPPPAAELPAYPSPPTVPRSTASAQPHSGIRRAKVVVPPDELPLRLNPVLPRRRMQGRAASAPSIPPSPGPKARSVEPASARGPVKQGGEDLKSMLEGMSEEGIAFASDALDKELKHRLRRARRQVWCPLVRCGLAFS